MKMHIDVEKVNNGYIIKTSIGSRFFGYNERFVAESLEKLKELVGKQLESFDRKTKECLASDSSTKDRSLLR